MTRRARRIHAGHKQQLDTDKPLTLARCATALGNVEGKLPGVIARRPRLGSGGEQLAHVVEQPGIGRQIGARRTTDGFLIDLHQALDRLQPGRDLAAADLRRVVLKAQLFSLSLNARPSQLCTDQFQQRLTDQTRLAGTGHTGHRSETAQGKFGTEVVEVIAGDAFQLQPRRRLARGTRLAWRFGEQISAGLRLFDVGQPRRWAAVQHLTALLTRRRPDVDQPVSAAHGFQIMLNHKQRVAIGLQALQGFEQRLSVGWVQTGGGFVEHVNHAKQLRAQLRRQSQALQLTGRQGRRTAFQSQIAQTQFGQRGDPFQQILGNALRRQTFFQ